MTGHYESEAWRTFDLGHPGGEATTQSLLARSGLKAGAHILDLCSGAGDSVNFLQKEGFYAKGVDRPGVLGHAKAKYPHLKEFLFPWEGGERLPFPDQFFDGVLCECALSLFEDKESILKEVQRVLKEEGLLLLSDMTDTVAPSLPGFILLDWQDESQHLKTFIARWLWTTETPYPRTCQGDDYFSGIYKKSMDKGVDYGF